MTEKEAIAIIDDEDSTRMALSRLLGIAGFEAFGFASADEFLNRDQGRFIHCVILDLLMPGIDGLDLQSILAERMPNVGVVFISGHADVPSTVDAMKAGAVDFLQKPVKRSKLVQAVESAIRRTHAAENKGIELRELKSRYSRLTPREREVFALVSAGLLNKQIAAEYRLSVITVKQHRGVVMKKMDAYSLADLAVMAERLGVRPLYTDFSEARGLIRLN